jgi:glycosyltransferase involved in cell wall biosynthesis
MSGWWRQPGESTANAQTATPNFNAQTITRRLYVDIAVISHHDAGTGIQRVVREIAQALDKNPAKNSKGGPMECPIEWDLCFVSASRKRRYHHINWAQSQREDAGKEMRAQPGDVFLGLDFSLDTVRRHRRQLSRFRQQGGALWFFMYDLLPLNRPEWFSPTMVIRFRAWLSLLARMADGFFCISPHTETELRLALTQTYGLTMGFRTEIIPMGNIVASDGNEAADAEKSPRFDTQTPFALMVGTLEPRKGHEDIIKAFEKLWESGNTIKLVIVGRQGWKIEALCDYIKQHPERMGAGAVRLLWFDDMDDRELVQLYAACMGVIVGSYGEGFGLPVIEALGYNKPVLARDLPVFHIHKGKGVDFFPEQATPHELAAVLGAWLEAAGSGAIQVNPPCDTWDDAARLLLATLENNKSDEIDMAIQQRSL